MSTVVHDSLALSRGKKRSSVLTCSPRTDDAPIPPTLLHRPYLTSQNSVFRRKIALPRWPSQRDDEWLRDMVPVDGSLLASDADAKSEASNDSTTPSPTSSESSFGSLLFPPSPMLRPRSTGPDVPASARRALCGSGSVTGQSPHN